MNPFEEKMQQFADSLSSEAKAVVSHVINAEHRRRFSDDRSDLPDDFATRALQVAMAKEAQK
ncbi:hypothetical protein [Streptomyces sp. SLBN-134]|uniref:hypothetical protein n=1 Tax=Streptomyces sp. SLBN-134 TaxID=2768456 RepID=UPI00116F875E|nr:hypothetical protein [Streptomyces sp. SLBN-134]TQL20172.1 hypothetical protein FBY37_2123 [Streptomyces sp. SLBN-134]